MGTRFLDQYSFLHFSSGVIAYFFNIPLWAWIIINFIFEAFENSEFGMSILQKVSFWPGGQNYRDSNINIVGDILSVIVGWGAAYFVDYLGNKYGWHSKNI